MKSKNWVFLSFEQIKNRKVQVGIALALTSLLVCGIMFSWSVGLLFALLFGGISVIKVEACTDWNATFLNVLWGLACIAVVVSISPLGGFKCWNS